MKNTIFHRSEVGASVPEYLVLTGFFALALFLAVPNFGITIAAVFADSRCVGIGSEYIENNGQWGGSVIGAFQTCAWNLNQPESPYSGWTGEDD